MLGGALLLLLVAGFSGRAGATPPDGPEVERIRTGEPDVHAWAVRRRAMALAALRGPTMDVPFELLDDVALSLLAQWAHETGRGKSEFNFNLGGWRARRADPYFTAKDVQEGGSAVYWTAYPDLPAAVDDQVQRLKRGFPKAWSMLLANPRSSAWVEQLGSSGYYTASRARYARAWAMHRAELGAFP